MGRTASEDEAVGRPRRAARALSGLRRIDAETIALWTLVAGAGWAFVRLAGGAMGDGFAFDERLLMALREAGDPKDPLGPLWLEEVVRDLTSLGGYVNLGLLTVLVTGFLLLQRRPRVALAVVLVVSAGALLGHLLKELFDRPRPDLVPHSVRVGSASFPSGHALMSAVVYMTLGALLARLQTRAALRFYCILAAGILTALVGLTRVYLGVHWPSDVLAGWALGGLWALGAWLLLRRLQSSHAVEPPAPEEG